MSSQVAKVVAVNGLMENETPAKPLKVGIKRKRSVSPEGEAEKSESKRSELPKGHATAAASPTSQTETEGTPDRVVILDAGAQYGKVGVNCVCMLIPVSVVKVIDRRVRELCVKADLLPLDTPAEKLKADGYKSVCLYIQWNLGITDTFQCIYSDNTFLPTKEDDLSIIDKMPMCPLCRSSTVALTLYCTEPSSSVVAQLV